MSLLAGGCAKALKKDAELGLSAPTEFQGSFENYDPSKALAQRSTTAVDPGKPAPLPAAEIAKKKPPKVARAGAQTKKHKKTPAEPLPVEPPSLMPPVAPPAAEPTLHAWSAAEWPFGTGEKISWVLRYGPIEGGVATLSVEPLKVMDGEPVLHYRGLVKSSKILDLFYKVDNEIQSWVRARDHIPLRQEIKQNESGRWGQRVVRFDPVKSVASFYSHMTLKDGRIEETRREDAVSPNAQDIFGALYFYRFAENIKRINFPIHDRWRNWNNEIVYLGEETIEVPAGRYDTYHFKMFPRVSGALEPKGDVEMWLWKHPSKIVVQFKAKIKVGSIVGELKSYEAGAPLPLPPPQMRTPINLTEMGELPLATK